MNPIILVIGTRPEGIKLIPVYYALKRQNFPVFICSTTQHRELLDEVFSLFLVRPDIELNIMIKNQDLSYITEMILNKTTNIFKYLQPSCVIVQGDTTTAMASAQAAFYLNIPVCHVEAGLRTHNILSPFPEELNRQIIGLLTTIHCAPTEYALQNLQNEHKNDSSLFLTGNTVVDALRIIKERIESKKIIIESSIEDFVKKHHTKNIVLLTTHRRESHKNGLKNILAAVIDYAQRHKDTMFFYPVHPNPIVKKIVEESNISQMDNIYLSKPIAYKDLIYVLINSAWVATDSGGIIEEAVSLGKKVLILRNETERQEAILSRAATLAGTETEYIIQAMETIHTATYVPAKSLYGEGFASEKIVTIILDQIIAYKSPAWYASNNIKELS